MTRLPDKHLDESEVEALAAAWLNREPTSPADLPSAEAHVKQCEECTGIVQSLVKAEDVLSSLRNNSSVAGSECREMTDWHSVAAGVMPRQQALEVLDHAALCNHCGARLRDALDDVRSETTSEEEAILEALESSSPVWQERISRKLSQVSAAAVLPPKPKRWFQVQEIRFALAAAAMLLLGIGSSLVLLRLHRQPVTQIASANPSTALTLISQAYGEHRTIEPRFPNAAFSPMVVQRGTHSSSLDRPAALLKAEDMISEGLRQNPGDLSLTQAMARANLLDGNYDSAIDELTETVSSRGDAGSLLLDLGSAYFVRGEQTGNAQDYGLAIEYQSRYLAVPGNQGDPVALFNRAIAEERAFQYNAALKDWDAFLHHEPDKRWRDEGQRRYDELQKRLKDRRQSNVMPERDPTVALVFLRARANRREVSDSEPLDEAYLRLALDEWVGALSWVPGKEARERHRSALEALSEVMAKLHHDDWLTELLTGPANADWNLGLVNLSGAAEDNETGDSKNAVDRARDSIEAFRKAGNRAGVVAGEFELIFALNHSQRGDQCLRTGQLAKRELSGARYPWLEAQISFAMATCWSINQNPQKETKESLHGEELARSANYDDLALYGAYFLDGVATQDVATVKAWNRVHEGLREFWASALPSRNGALFYTDLGFLAEKEQLLYLAEIVGEEKLAFSESAPNLVTRAASHSWLAKIVEAKGERLRAESEFQKADQILITSGYDTSAAQVTLEIERASLEVAGNDFLRANTHLAEAAKHLALVQDTSRLMRYYEACGAVDLRAGRLPRAQEELLKAISLMEKAKQSLFSESDLLTWQYDTSQAYRTLLELYTLDPAAEMRSMAFLEWYRGTPLRFDRRSPSRFKLELLGQSLSPGHSVSGYRRKLLAMTSGVPILTWASFPSATVIWEFDHRGDLHSVRVPVSRALLSQTASELAQLCSDPSSDTTALNKYARQLYDWLIAPVSEYLPPSGALIIEPDDPLNLVPFQALKSEDGRFFGEMYALRESPGLFYSAVRRLPAPPISSSMQVLAVGDPLPPVLFNGKALPRLRDADREARDVAARFERNNLLSGSEATLGQVLRLLPRAQIFHFAGHAESREPQAGLFLVPESGKTALSGLLKVSALRSNSLQRLQLAVFSGCETAVADRGMMDSGSLVRAFLREGVPEVVASKWRVDSLASAQIMDHFYACLLKGDSVPAALAQAEKSIRSNPATSHPYYWSGFSVFGV